MDKLLDVSEEPQTATALLPVSVMAEVPLYNYIVSPLSESQFPKPFIRNDRFCPQTLPSSGATSITAAQTRMELTLRRSQQRYSVANLAIHIYTGMKTEKPGIPSVPSSVFSMKDKDTTFTPQPGQKPDSCVTGGCSVARDPHRGMQVCNLISGSELLEKLKLIASKKPLI
jgi:hypothetical protein